MNFRIFGTFVVILLDESLSSVLRGNKSSNILSECSKNNQIQVNMVPRAKTSVVEANITLTFHVDVDEDNSIIGRIEVLVNDDTAPMAVKLLSFVDGHIKDEDYYLLLADVNVRKEDDDRKYARINCIHIPPSVNTSIKAEVYRINSTSCDCDVKNIAKSDCLDSCQIDFISSYSFQASKDACVLYRKTYQNALTMHLLGEIISKEVTRFRGYFSNVNPFSSAQVSLFPDDEFHYPHVPILTFPAKIDENGGIYFSVEADNLGYVEFYAKLQVKCPGEYSSVDYISDSLKIKPYVPENYTDEGDAFTYGDNDATGSEDKQSEKDNTEVLYGVLIGVPVTACIVTIIVWAVHRNKRRSPRQEADKDQHTQLCSPPIRYTGKTNEMNNSSNMTTRSKEVMVLAHPDTIKHVNDVDDLVTCLEMHDIRAHNRPEVQFQNWRDFAEKVGEEYQDVVIILSRGLIELCEIYKSKGRSVNIGNVTGTSSYSNKHLDYKQKCEERWNGLLEQRNGEYIPCVALDKLRTVIQDKRSEVRIHFVSFCDTNEHSSSGVCDENKPNTVNLQFSCPHFKQNQNDHRLQQQQKQLNHHGNDDLILTVGKSVHFKSNRTSGLESFLKSRDQDYVWEFIKHNTFLQTKNTYFHTISRNVLKHLLMSEIHNYDDVNIPSLIHILKDLK